VTDSIWYIFLVDGAAEALKSFLMISGFLQTFSFFSKFGESPSLRDAVKFTGHRLAKVLPIYYFMLIFILMMQDKMGYGPFWHLMDSMK